MLTLVTAAAAPVVSLTEAKAHLNVTHSDDDDLIQLYLDAAIAHVDGAEGVLGRCLVTQEWDYTLDEFCNVLKLPLPTLQDVTSITYRDGLSDVQTVNAADYMVAGQRITAPDGWPDTDGYLGAVTVRFTAGYGDTAADVPAAIKAAILLLVGDAYANREASGEQLFDNPSVKRLLAPYKVWRA